jgi:hypothetical protein
VVFLIWLLTGGVGEETGWRGWLMPTLATRFGFVPAALIVAFVWGLWHAPQFLFNPGFRGMGWATIGWLLALIAGSFWLGWLARLGRWSIVPIVLWHGAFDLLTSSDLGPATLPATVSTIVMVQAVVVVTVLAVRRARARAEQRSPRGRPEQATWSGFAHIASVTDVSSRARFPALDGLRPGRTDPSVRGDEQVDDPGHSES